MGAIIKNCKKNCKVRNVHRIFGGNPIFLFVINCYETWSMVYSVDSKMIPVVDLSVRIEYGCQ